MISNLIRLVKLVIQLLKKLNFSLKLLSFQNQDFGTKH